MSLIDEVRLLPWTGPEGKPCYLSGDGVGFMSRLADNVEAAQLGLAGDLIEEAQQVLAERAWTPGELHLLAMQLTEALVNVHRIAQSQGARLPAPAYEEPNAIDDEEDLMANPRD
ncbi:hypothetical protein FBY35_6158 [Streptomyces sp. SLBN-118]|uniref:hypothetical protein n=1 Tax=Streptomyces sp. SLBN-118 TaxID=2768454 RepID=UPI00114DEC28|nr:hypothetical protein [Streptomyces sp. SLBN-118]TQK44642.1 hypothetical protein FBY35_6158 [Streptomyces sp. SLBN-118]